MHALKISVIVNNVVFINSIYWLVQVVKLSVIVNNVVFINSIYWLVQVELIS